MTKEEKLDELLNKMYEAAKEFEEMTGLADEEANGDYITPKMPEVVDMYHPDILSDVWCIIGDLGYYFGGGDCMKFKNGDEMLSILRDATDLYNAEEEKYVFLYNDCSSIAVYDISNEEADELRKLSAENGEYWGAMLGPGGRIYDDPSYEDYDENLCSNLNWCNDNHKGEWEVV